MKGFLHPDNPVFRAITKFVYSAYLNILWMICSLPVVTAGAATAALFSVTLALARDEDPSLTRDFFRAFRQNFRQATLIWLILLAVGAFLAVDGYVVYRLVYQSPFWTVLAAVLIVAALVYLTVCLYVFPLLARYENSTVNMFKNALAIGLRYLFCTILMALIYFAMAFIVINLFTPALVFGFGTCAYLCSGLLGRVFPQGDGAA